MATHFISNPAIRKIQPDWQRFFPNADHKWVMGLRRNDAAAHYKGVDEARAVIVPLLRAVQSVPQTTTGK